MKVFKEEQRFTQLWLIVTFAVSMIVPNAIFIQENLKEGSSLSSTQFTLTLLFVIASVSFIYFFKLKTRIDKKGTHYQPLPFYFSLKTVCWKEINKAKPNAAFTIIKNMNHLLKDFQKNENNMKSYTTPNSWTSKKLVQTIVKFVKK